MPVCDPRLDATACHPCRKAPRMVVASIVLRRQFSLTVGGPAELAAPNHESVIQHPPLLEIKDQRGTGLINVFALRFVLGGQPTVRIPTAMEDLDVSDAAFSQPSRVQAAGGEGAGSPRVGSVEFKGLLRSPQTSPSARAPKPACGRPFRAA